ncbi:MAG: hypothetical protein H6505_06380 [Calditrichaeota bacterium]|nr:hypothetical protein [Calditrichota bacterium]
MKTGILILVFCACAAVVEAQDFTIVGATVQLNGYSEADNSCFDPDLCFVPSPLTNDYFANTYVPGGLGFDLGLSRGHHVTEDDDGGPCCGTLATWAHCNNFGYSGITGAGTDFITIYYGISGYNQAGNDNWYKCRTTDTLSFAILLEIDNGPAGFPVTVDYSWDHFGGIGGAHEGASEDCVFTRGSLTVDSDGEVLQNRFNFGSGVGGLFGWNRRSNQTGQFSRFVGDQLLIEGWFELDVNTNVPSPFPAQTLDDQSATQWGKIRLSLGTPIVPVPPDTLANAWLEFSVDIGGDCEMSDPTPEGNEVFDPGDSYVWLGPPLPVGGADGITNDEILFGPDPPPIAPDGTPPATGAPVGSGLLYPDVAPLFFDLDGEDYLNFNLNDLGYGPGDPPIGRFDSPCIHEAINLFVSFEDDLPSLYTDPGGSAPVNSLSANLATHGQITSGDEVVGLNVFPGVIPAPVFFKYPYLTEEMLHVSLAPNPLPFGEEDDDADALDIRDGQCPIWYFSVDHEAVFGGLDPGTIYMKVGGGPGGGFTGVIDPVLHLGLQAGVDIDAFEFVWITQPDGTGDGLALLYSVDEDDPATPMNESSGRNPALLYASYLNGTSFQYLDTPLEDDIDALTAWPTALFASYTTPSVCDPPSDVVIKATESGLLSNLLIRFVANEDAVYQIYSTTDPLASPPPGPVWTVIYTVNAIPGEVVTYNTVSATPLDPFRQYVVTATCP